MGTIEIKVSELAKARGWDAMDIVRQCFISYGTANQLMKGGGKGITYEVLVRLCDCFEVTPDEILEYKPKKKRKK